MLSVNMLFIIILKYVTWCLSSSNKGNTSIEETSNPNKLQISSNNERYLQYGVDADVIKHGKQDIWIKTIISDRGVSACYPTQQFPQCYVAFK